MKRIAGWTVLAAAIAGCAAAATPPADDMQASMRTMQQQMEKIRASKDPAERQALLDQHMQAMQRHMELMKNMMGTPAAPDAAGKGAQSGAMGCGTMMNGMDMMQSMMRQMQQHLDVEKTPAPKGK